MILVLVMMMQRVRTLKALSPALAMMDSQGMDSLVKVRFSTNNIVYNLCLIQIKTSVILVLVMKMQRVRTLKALSPALAMVDSQEMDSPVKVRFSTK